MNQTGSHIGSFARQRVARQLGVWQRVARQFVVPQLITPTLDFFLPPRCATCDIVLARAPALCGQCWSKLDFIDGPICNRTGAPLPFDLGPQTISLNAMRHPPAYHHARAALYYTDTARVLIRRFKFHDRPELANLMVPWLLRAGEKLLAHADIIMPVPLHWTRLFGRRFNQSAELARKLADLTGIDMQVEWLRRTRRTPQQIGLTRADRRKNLRGAFTVPKKYYRFLRGKQVVLIDDVMTTGATVEACAKVLRRVGVAQINVLTVARVVLPETVHI
ncbi:MAG: ComF family protein [Alphaproteobacteria bacterium]|nr:ComF family protein [Alphaproteobacteria bacterium]